MWDILVRTHVRTYVSTHRQTDKLEARSMRTSLSKRGVHPLRENVPTPTPHQKASCSLKSRRFPSLGQIWDWTIFCFMFLFSLFPFIFPEKVLLLFLFLPFSSGITSQKNFTDDTKEIQLIANYDLPFEHPMKLNFFIFFCLSPFPAISQPVKKSRLKTRIKRRNKSAQRRRKRDTRYR